MSTTVPHPNIINFIDNVMSKKPLEEQLKYYLEDKGWEIFDILPPDYHEVTMYVKVTRKPEQNLYEVPQLPGYRLELLYIESEIFVFSVFEKGKHP